MTAWYSHVAKKLRKKSRVLSLILKMQSLGLGKTTWQNADKFQMMLLDLKESIRYCLDIKGNITINTDTVKLLGVKIDSKLNLLGSRNTHLENQEKGAFLGEGA